jgi:hypothetical protein
LPTSPASPLPSLVFGAKHPLPAGSIKSNQGTDLSKIFVSIEGSSGAETGFSLLSGERRSWFAIA